MNLSLSLAETDCRQIPIVFNITFEYFSRDLTFETKFAELVIYVINTSLLTASIVVTGYNMKFRIAEYDRLKARSFPLIVAGHIAAFVQLQTGALTKLLDSQVPCNLLIIASLLIVPLVLMPLSVKLIQFRKQDFLTRAAAVGLEIDEENKSTSMGTIGDGDASFRLRMPVMSFKPISILAWMRTFFVILLSGSRKSIRTRESMKGTITTVAESAHIGVVGAAPTVNKPLPVQMEDGTAVPTTREILLWRYSAGPMGGVATLAVLNIPFIIIAMVSFRFVHPIYFTDCLGCRLGPTHALFIIAEGALAIALMSFLAWTLRRRKDPFEVLKEIKLVIVFGAFPALVSFALNYVRMQSTLPGFSFNQLVSIWLVVGSLLQGWFQVLLAQREASMIRDIHNAGVEVEEDFANSPGPASSEFQGRRSKDDDEVNEEKRDRVESLVRVVREGESFRTHGANSTHRVSQGLNYGALLQMVLNDPVFRNAFHAHLCEEHNVEPLTFLDTVDRWKLHFPHSTPEMSHIRAKRILKGFIGPRAPFPIPLSSAQVDNLIRKTARPSGLTLDTFDAARVEVLKMLEFGPLVRFTRSNIWKGFVEDGLVLEDIGGLTPRPLTRNSSANPPVVHDIAARVL